MKAIFSRLFAFAALSSLVAASPVARSECGQYLDIEEGQYIIYTDAWGEANASSGETCISYTSLSGTTIAWETNWNWSGGSGVKSYSNVALNSGLNVKLSSVTSAPTTWKWSQSDASSEVADVAYDIFTSTSSGGSAANEIMIWMANYNAGPISSSYSSSGSAEPSVSGISLAGYTWDLYIGSNGSNEVYSFLLADGDTITSFSADLNDFFEYLTTTKGYFSSSQYLTTVEAGTEATSGSATLTTSAYSVVVNS